ncbi:LacI family DNA-binding transcriptional regulator [Domibacillus indicus]|uniref:LacI family DNA-binding transcriptional regulator n=1 Tax=Domibacillus indicus TaxID=1437523 RepID=UPI00288C3CBB|nr:LacI family DNA-binding transcriptional regulator [Domibacillus indicus]
MKPTIYDVAKKAGVSISTVSKVLNNTGNLADKTRKKVQETMQELNYQPSVTAYGIRKKANSNGRAFNTEHCQPVYGRSSAQY